MPQFRKHAALPLRSLLSLETHLQREKRKKALVNFPSQVTSPLKVQRTLAVSSGQFGLAVSTKPKDARRSWARPEPHSPSCFFGANVQSRSPRSSPPSSPGTPGLRGRLRARAPSKSQTLVPRSGSNEHLSDDPRTPCRNTGLPHRPCVSWSPGITTPAHHRRGGGGGGLQPQVGALTCSGLGLPVPTGDEVPEQAMPWGPARSSFQELGSAPGSASLHPLIQELHPREEMGGKSWAAARERAAPPRAVSSPCRAPPGAVRAARGGRASQVEARRPARPRSRPSMPSAASSAGSRGL